jgi:histidine ammonia-lyase
MTLPIFVIQASMRYQDTSLGHPPSVDDCLEKNMQEDFVNMTTNIPDRSLVMCKNNPGRILVYAQSHDLTVLGNMTSIDSGMLPEMERYAEIIKSPFHEFLTICRKHKLALVKYLTT